METILVDTDVFIDFLRGHEERISDIFSTIQSKNLIGIVSTITIVELYTGEDSRSEKKRAVLDKLLSYFTSVAPDTHIAQQAGILRREYGVGLADGIIAATALNENALLFTFNLKHFRRIPGLKMYRITQDNN